MNILITGALGHIGSYLLDKGCFAQHQVTAVDNMLTQRYCSLLGLKHRPHKFIESDFSDISDDIIEKSDVILHLAAITNAADSFIKAKQMEAVNVVKTKEFIDRIAAQHGTRLFIFPSSTSVYGKASEDVIEDDDQFLNPQSPYAHSKIQIERYLAQSGVDHRILRLGTIFGTSKGMRFHTAINKFCYQASMGLPLTVWRENYDQHRPYLGLQDAASAIKIMMSSIYGSERGGIYNVVSENMKLSDIVDLIRDRVPEVNIDFIDTPLLNQYPYKVNFEKVSALGFSPQEKVSYGIDETLKLLGR